MKYFQFIAIIVMVFLFFGCKSKMNYDNIYSYQDNYAVVERNGKIGVIDTSFHELIKPTLDDFISYDLSPYFFDSWFYGIRNDSLIVYDTAGVVIHYYKMDKKLTPNILSDRSYFIDSLLIRTANKTYLFSGSKNWGCVSLNGDTIVPFDYEKIKPGLDNHIIASRGNEKNLRIYVYNTKGDTIWRTYNVPILPWKINNCYFFKSPEKSIQIWNSYFEPLDTIYYNDLVVTDNFVWFKSEEIWNRYDSNLKFIDGPYTHVHLNNYWGAVWKNEKVAFINTKGELISDFIYEGSVSDYFTNSRLIVTRNKKQFQILNENGNVIRAFKREE